MDLIAKLAKLLGLADGATEADVTGAVEKLCGGKATSEAALQAALDPIAEAAGAQKGSKPEIVLAAVKVLATKGDGKTITELQSELANVTTQLNTIVDAGKRKDAETFVDAAIAAKRVGIKPMRDRYITMHMADPKGTEELINANPILGNTGAGAQPPKKAADGTLELNAEQSAAAKALGIDPKAYAKTLADEAAAEAAL